MLTIKVNEEEYKLEFGFEAAENKDVVQKMFKILTGSYLLADESPEDEKELTLGAMFNGTANMVADIPHICISAFHAGLQENNPMGLNESKTLMKLYMKENGLTFHTLYEELKKCMEDDGFFDLSGLTAMVNQMMGTEQKPKAKPKKVPQDHLKKSTSTN